jgi:hypothetical protein
MTAQVTVTHEQLSSVHELARQMAALELVVVDAGGGLAHVRGYAEHGLLFTASVDDLGGVHDFLTYEVTT